MPKPNPHKTPDSVAQTQSQLERQKFGEFLAKHYRLALWIAFQVCNEQEDAREAVQNAALKAWKKRHLIKAPEPHRGWYSKIVRREALQIIRRRRQIVSLEGVGQEMSSGRDNEQSRFVRICLERLERKVPREHYQMFVQRFILGATLDEIRSDHSTSLSTVKRILAQCRLTFSGLLGAGK